MIICDAKSETTAYDRGEGEAQVTEQVTSTGHQDKGKTLWK